MNDSNLRREQTIRAAWLYHQRGLNQQAVAHRLGVSRSTVSRLLADAERDGIVRVTVTVPLPEAADLVEQLVDTFDLVDATVELTLDDELPREAAAAAMANRLERIVTGGSLTIAAGWGGTLGAAAQRTRVMHTSGVTLVDAFGHTPAAHIATAVEVTNTLGQKFGAAVTHIPSPGFAPTADIAANFFESESIATALNAARNADMVMVAVGVVGGESLLLEAGYMEASTMDELIAAGAVGEVFGKYFDADGHDVMPGALHPVGLSLDDLRNCKRVVAVAGGVEKADAVKGALVSGIIDELAVDDSLARALLG